MMNLSPASYGWTGVTLFFIISGFLIHLGYLKNENNFNTLTFYSKRFWRIYPPYWITLIFFSLTTGLLASVLVSKTALLNFGLHFLAMHNASDKTFYTINSSYWSLAAEVQLYLLYPFFLYLRKKMGIKITFYLVCVLSVVLTLIGIKYNNFGSIYAYNKSVFVLWFVWVAGAYYAEIFAAKKKILNNSGLFISLLLSLLLIPMNFCSFLSYFEFPVSTLAWIVFFDWFLYKESIKMDSFFSKIIITIGLCSYSIYLIHQPYLSNLLQLNLFSSRYIFRVLNVVPAFALIFLISWLLYRFVELPSVQLGNKFRKKAKQQSQ